MKVVYYPETVDPSLQTPLRKFICEKLQKKSLPQWKRMYHWIEGLKRGPYTSVILKQEIAAEWKKAWEKRKIGDLGDGLYEFRGSQSPKGTIRVYFCYVDETVYMLHAEYKTDEKDEIETARNRKKVLGL